MTLDDPSLPQHYAEHGFVVIDDFATPTAVATLRQRAAEIVDAFDAARHRATFSTRDRSAARDDYFLTSGRTIRCFFEEGAFAADGALAQPKALSINKIGHALHELDATFERFSHDARLASLAPRLGLMEPRVYQSMYIFKQPHIGGAVDWHQDATYFVTEPITVTTFWLALERADRSNGCLWVQPGGHRSPLRERFVVEDGVSRLETLDATPWPDDRSAAAVEVKSGTLVVMHGKLPHHSAPNTSAASRHAYVLHAVDGRARYASTNWLQCDDAMPARGFGDYDASRSRANNSSSRRPLFP